MLAFHAKHQPRALVTVLGKKVSESHAKNYGCMVLDQNSAAVLHFAEKPETFVSDLANCGVYIFSPAIFARIQAAAESEKKEEEDLFLSMSGESPRTARAVRRISLENDVFVHMAGKDEMFCCESSDFWVQVKNASYVTKLNEMMLQQLRRTNAAQLRPAGPNVSGDVFVHPSASVHPTAKLGPNVSIGPKVVVRAGARIKHAIVLDESEVKEHAYVLYSVVGIGCNIGQWARVEGLPPTADDKIDKSSVGVTILAKDVTVAPEVIIRNSIVLPHKSLTESYSNEILL